MKQLQSGVSAEIEAQIRERFRKVADGPEGHFAYPTGQEGLLRLKYPCEVLESLPAVVQSYYCGVGNPFTSGVPDKGAKVLDVGSGAGIDALVAAFYVGPEGMVTGLEFSPEMRERAQTNAQVAGVRSVSFVEGTAQKLPFEDESFDMLISNGVYNLVLRKRQALSEAFRVLRPGGKLQIADQILEGETPQPVNPLGPSAWAT